MSDTPYVGGSQPSDVGLTGDSHRVACLFATRATAERAADDLVAAGVPRGALDIVDQPASGAATAQDSGVWASIKRLFTGDESESYYEGVNRGNVLLTVHTANAAEAERAGSILERHDPIDLTAEETAWREAGWTGRSTGLAETDVAQTGMAQTGMAQTGMAQTGMAQTGIAETAPMATPGAAAMAATKPVAPTTATATPAMAGRAEAAATTGDGVIPLVQEDVAIGKRAVAGGTVRVRTHVVATPVNETVQLRDERVQVDRRPADRALAAGDDAFRERTVEMSETREEPVISKSTRVTEELVVRKEANERAEQVSETARRTEAEVEDSRTRPGMSEPARDI